MSEAKILNDKEKLQFIIKSVLKVTQKDITQRLEIQKNVISEILNPQTKRVLKKYHVYAIAMAYDIPLDIFEDDTIDSKSKILFLLAQNKKLLASSQIDTDSRIKFQNLIGSWYLYVHTSNIDLDQVIEKGGNFIQEERLFIDKHFDIEDQKGNLGVLQVFDNQSVIIMKDSKTKDIVLYTFDNNRLSCDTFFINRISRINHSNREVLSFGFLSKKRIAFEKVREVLGNIEDTQLRASCRMVDKISFCNSPQESTK
ncbi:MAG: hypothetical protein U9N49_10435 [Campylobacterota bacterium]|nr:hypothetical protein [Campylobacterota bacterium]